MLFRSESRLANAMRICRFARMLSKQGAVVVAATMSLFREVHSWNRANLPGYFEVYLKMSLEALRARDPRGLYRRAAAGEAKNVAGVDLEFDAPDEPDLVLQNDVALESFEVPCRRILEAARGALSRTRGFGCALNAEETAVIIPRKRRKGA